MSDNGQEEAKAYRLPIEWYYPDDLRTGHATNFIVQHTKHEFYLSFFDFPPPILLGTDEEKKEELESLDSVRATAVARVAISTGRLQELIDTLQDNLNKYQARYGENTEE